MEKMEAEVEKVEAGVEAAGAEAAGVEAWVKWQVAVVLGYCVNCFLHASL